MFLDICELKGKYRGANRDVNSELFFVTKDFQSDLDLYCDFCNYNLEFNGEEEIFKSRLDMMNKLNKYHHNAELLIFDNKPIKQCNLLKFLGFDILNEHFESPLTYNKGTFFIDNQKYLNENLLFEKLSDAQNSLKTFPQDEAGNKLTIYYIYTYID